jgi:hypothetical protein
MKCKGKIPELSGIICGNFGCRTNGERECRNAWHGACFKQDKGDTFPVLQVRDLDDSLVDESALEDDDPNRFKEAREGDYIMTPFQCPECHFFNIKQRVPVEGDVDKVKKEVLRFKVKLSLDCENKKKRASTGGKAKAQAHDKGNDHSVGNLGGVVCKIGFA